MKYRLALFLIIITSLAFNSCKKMNHPESDIVRVESTNGGEVWLNAVYSYSRFDNVKTGICWSDSGSIPVREEYYDPIQGPNFTENTGNKKSGSKTLQLQDVTGEAPLKARSYIKFNGASTVYGNEVFDFKTDLFQDMNCKMEVNELQYGESIEPILTTGSFFNADGYFIIYGSSNSYDIFFYFSEIPKRRDAYRASNYYPSSIDRAAVVIKNRFTGCEYRISTIGNVYVNYVFGREIYIQFCDFALETSSCSPYNLEFSTLLKVKL